MVCIPVVRCPWIDKFPRRVISWKFAEAARDVGFLAGRTCAKASDPLWEISGHELVMAMIYFSTLEEGKERPCAFPF